MKDNSFLHKTVQRFADGLAAAMSSGSDTFSFEFDPKEWPEDKPLLIQSADPSIADKTMTLMVLIRPKIVADPMLEVMQAARARMLASLEQFDQRRPKTQKAIG